jgi:Mn-containing catalase
MATAMSADRTTMGQLTNAIADLTAQLSARDQEITTLKSKLRGNNSGTNNNTNSNRESSQSTAWVNGKHRRDRGGYCWTHGFLVAKDAHTSANCNAQSCSRPLTQV